MIFDVNFKHFGETILLKSLIKFSRKIPMFFTVENSLFKIIFAQCFLFVNRFSKFLQHILQQTWYETILPPSTETIKYHLKSILRSQNQDNKETGTITTEKQVCVPPLNRVLQPLAPVSLS